MEPTTTTHDGHAGALYVVRWDRDDARYLAVLCHGYGEHIGRYEHVADALVDHGAAVVGLDHAGHGRSEGTRVLIADYEDVVADLHRVVTSAHDEHPELPVVLIGHSMGGMIAARYAQLHGDELAALVLSGPVLGRWEAAEQLLALDPIPEVPIDPETLSRDPAVGEAYAADPLVWHGSFERTTLEALRTCLARIDEGGEVADLPTLWVHGEDDQLVPIGPSRAGVRALVPPEQLTEEVRADARHEVFNETDRDEVIAEVTAFVDRVLAR
jgi:alpha-beta hydrolase superfamily lysophospholipase